MRFSYPEFIAESVISSTFEAFFPRAKWGVRTREAVEIRKLYFSPSGRGLGNSTHREQPHLRLKFRGATVIVEAAPNLRAERKENANRRSRWDVTNKNEPAGRQVSRIVFVFAWRGSVPPSPDSRRWWDGTPPPPKTKLLISSSYSCSLTLYCCAAGCGRGSAWRGWRCDRPSFPRVPRHAASSPARAPSRRSDVPSPGL